MNQQTGTTKALKQWPNMTSWGCKVWGLTWLVCFDCEIIAVCRMLLPGGGN